MTSAICNNAPIGATARLRDTRGRGNAGTAADSTYGIVKAKDGNCWMTENFDLYNKTISASESDFASGTYILPNSSSWTTNDYTKALIHKSTIAGYENELYYNWCSATATTNSTSPNCSTSSQVNQSICPSGWKLPIEGSTSGSYRYLLSESDASSGNILMDMSNEAYILGFNRYYGNYSYDAGDIHQGNQSFFWSSTPYGGFGSAYTFTYWDSGLSYPNIYRGTGSSIRCVAR